MLRLCGEEDLLKENTKNKKIKKDEEIKSGDDYLDAKRLRLFVNRIFSDHIGSRYNHQLVKKPQQCLWIYIERSCKI